MTNVYPPKTINDKVTSFLPLTTSFAAAPGCSNSYILRGTRLVAYDPAYGLSISSNAKCQPAEVTTSYLSALLTTPGNDPASLPAISIGPLQCPEDWNTQATSIKSLVSKVAVCCPPGYFLVGGQRFQVVGDCVSLVESGATLTYASIFGSQSESFQMLTTTLKARATVSGFPLTGWIINESTAPATATPTSGFPIIATSRSIASNTNASNIANVAPATSQTAVSSTPGSSSATIKVGLGIGIAIGVIGLIALGVAIFLLRRSKQKQAHHYKECEELDSTHRASSRKHSSKIVVDTLPDYVSSNPEPRRMFSPEHTLSPERTLSPVQISAGPLSSHPDSFSYASFVPPVTGRLSAHPAKKAFDRKSVHELGG